MMELVIERASLTDVGRKRRHNEDFVGYFEPSAPRDLAASGRLYIVADGVGGRAAGEVASEYAVKKVLHHFFFSSGTDLAARLKAAILAAHLDLHEYAEMYPELGKMGTTLVAAIVRGNELIIGNVGDSRAYLLRNGKIRQVTRDHSLVAQLVEEGSITPQEAESHPRRNVLLRSLGADRSVHPDIFVSKLLPGDQVVLCSDGLTRHVSDAEILDLATRTRAERAVKRFVDLANERGGKDNISVILLRMTEPVSLETLAAKATPGAKLVAPEIEDLQATAHQQRAIGTQVPAVSDHRYPPLWLLLLVGAILVLLLLAVVWLLIRTT